MNAACEITWRHVAPRSVPRVSDSESVLREALANHQFREFLDRAAFDQEPVLLLINDGYRSTLTRPFLDAFAELTASRPRPPRFRVLVATGTHRIEKTERVRFETALFDQCGLQPDAIAWHDADHDGQLESVAGVSAHVWVAQSRFLLAIGSVEPHYFAGLTGPHKTVTIGVLSRNEIERNHALAVHESARPFRLHGNPVFDGIVAILRKWKRAGKDMMAVAEVVRGGDVVAAAVGDPLQTVFDLQDVVQRTYTYPLERPVDVLRLCVPLPLGRSFYQADKALRNNHVAVRNAGGIILEAQCPEGVGQDAFLSLLKQAPNHEIAKRLLERDGYKLGDHKAVNLRHLTDPVHRGVHLAVVGSRISAEDAQVLGIRRFDTTAEALAWIRTAAAGPIRRGLVVEDAGNLCTNPALRI